MAATTAKTAATPMSTATPMAVPFRQRRPRRHGKQRAHQNSRQPKFTKHFQSPSFLLIWMRAAGIVFTFRLREAPGMNKK
jgi:hypothetical protein